MTEPASRLLETRREWWERRRPAFSWAAAAGYALSIVVYELFTPWWAGDHVGFSPPSLIFIHGPGALVYLVAANVLYWLPRLMEPKNAPDPKRARQRVFVATVWVGALIPMAWLGVSLLEASLRRR